MWVRQPVRTDTPITKRRLTSRLEEIFVAGHGNTSVIDLDKYGKHSRAILLASLELLERSPGQNPPLFRTLSQVLSLPPSPPTADSCLSWLVPTSERCHKGVVRYSACHYPPPVFLKPATRAKRHSQFSSDPANASRLTFFPSVNILPFPLPLSPADCSAELRGEGQKPITQTPGLHPIPPFLLRFARPL